MINDISRLLIFGPFSDEKNVAVGKQSRIVRSNQAGGLREEVRGKSNAFLQKQPFFAILKQ